MNVDASDIAIRFGEITKQINGVYEAYAKSVGLSYTSLYVLHLVSMTKNCTQKYIRDHLFLPKQTINSVVSLFQKQGLFEMRELPEDRRHKTIHLTPKGREYAAQIIPKIDAAEIHSIQQFDDTEMTMLLRLMERYAKAFELELR